MTTVHANWRPHTCIPTGPVAAIIAIPRAKDFPDDVNTFLLPKLYNYNTKFNIGWHSECEGKELTEAVFWWLPEDELVSTLASVAEALQ